MPSLSALWAQITEFLAFDPARLGETEILVRLAIQVALFAGSSFFSGSETALFSLTRLDLQQLSRRRHPKARKLHQLLDQPRQLIVSILCGNELINIAATTNMTAILIALYGGERAGWVALVVMVPLLLLFGEVTPKTIAVSYPVPVSTKLVAGPLSLWVRLVTPLRFLVRIVSDRITTLLVGEARDAEHLLQVGEFRSLIEEIEQEGMLSATDRILVYNLLDAGKTEAVEIMTPRSQTVYLEATRNLEEMVREMGRHRYRCFPVYRGNRDQVVGFLYAEDLLDRVVRGEDLSQIPMEDVLQPPVLVPSTKSVDDLLEFLQDEDARAGMVLNEFGGVIGIVTLDDVLNFFFGEIIGPPRALDYEKEEERDVYSVPGGLKLDTFNDLTNFGVHDPRMTTIGGVVLRALDRLPAEGDRVGIDGLQAEVTEMEGHRIARLRIGRSEYFEEHRAEQPEEE